MRQHNIILIVALTLTIGLNACKVDSDIDDAASTIADAIQNGTNRDHSDTDDHDNIYTDDENNSYDGETGLQILDNNTPADRYFMGTFYKAAGYGQCAEFPSVTRLYSYGDTIFIENNEQDLLAVASIFEDDTFDFSYLVMDEFGDKVKSTCTCYYKENEWYGDEWNCTCENDDGVCDLNYDGKNN